MQRANRLLEIVKSERLQPLAIAPFAILAIGCAALALPAIWDGADRFAPPGSAAPVLIALIGLALFGIAAAGVAWLAIGALSRQQRVVAELHGRDERLREHSALLQSTLENMGEGLSVFDRHGRLIAWNSRFVEMFELPPPSAATSLHDILTFQARRGDFGPVDPEGEVSRRIERVYRNVPAVREWITASGRTLQIHRRAMPGDAVVTLYADVTEQKASEARMAQAWKEAELANRSKSDFLANMSHELRTPLNAIIGFSEVICGELLGPMRDKKYLGYIKDIHSSGLHLLSIINDVLDMSKIEAGKLELANEIVTVQRVIAESMRMVGERAHSRDIELVCEFRGTDSGIRGDERAIKQIMLNLLSNAVKFSHDGGRVDVRATLDTGGGLAFEIEDRGIGMSAEELERALQPFGQANTGAARVYGGTGLGLPITKGLIEAHGGELTIDTRPGQGTLVRVLLPPHPGAAVAANPPVARAPSEAHDARDRRAVA